MKCWVVGIVALIITGILSGCVSKAEKNEKIENVEYSILEKKDIPKEMQKKIEKVKHRPFRMTYRDEKNLYIAQGYGAQLTTGYSIAVCEVYETEDTIRFTTLLKGPGKQEKIKKISTFPYVVVKANNISKKVIFE